LRVEYTPRATRDGGRLDRVVRERILTAIDRFAATGYGDVKPLKGSREGEWRLRVGDWRVLYRLDKSASTMEILRILPRGEAYQVKEATEMAYASGRRG
jgi:mRNA interferase RelE/StbE